MTEIYGKLASDKHAEENLLCREIAREISIYGISDRQRAFLVYLLALELEDPQKMQELTACIKEVFGSTAFISSANVE